MITALNAYTGTTVKRLLGDTRKSTKPAPSAATPAVSPVTNRLLSQPPAARPSEMLILEKSTIAEAAGESVILIQQYELWPVSERFVAAILTEARYMEIL